MSMFKGGGGYLKNIAATLISITFDSKEWPGGKGKDPYHTISAKLTFLQDGATAPAFTFLKAGFWYPENQTISDDGTTLSSDREGAILQPNTELSEFINSIEAIDPSLFEGADGTTFSMVGGLRVIFDRKKDEAGTKEFGQRKYTKKDGSEGKADRDFLIVKSVLGKGAVPKGTAAPASSKKPAASSKKTTAAAPAAAKSATVDTSAADTALLAIIEAGKGSVERKVMGSKVTRYRLNTNMEEAAGEALRTLLMSDEYINDAVKRGVIDLDNGTITKA